MIITNALCVQGELIKRHDCIPAAEESVGGEVGAAVQCSGGSGSSGSSGSSGGFTAGELRNNLMWALCTVRCALHCTGHHTLNYTALHYQLCTAL